MAAATDLESLLNFAPAMRAAAAGVLTARLAAKCPQYGAQVYADLAADNKVSPRIEVHFVMGEATGHQRPAPAGLDYRSRQYDAFAGQFVFNVWTNRTTAAAEANDALCAVVRAMAADFVMYFTADNLPWYSIEKMRPGRVAMSTNTDKTMDVTQLPFDLHLGVRGDAWPVGY